MLINATKKRKKILNLHAIYFLTNTVKEMQNIAEKLIVCEIIVSEENVVAVKSKANQLEKLQRNKFEVKDATTLKRIYLHMKKWWA